MGWMGGLGSGMLSFSQSIEKQQVMNYQAKQDQLKFERSQNLENLRAKNNMAANQQNIDARAAEAELGRSFTLERDKAQQKDKLGYLDRQDELMRGRSSSAWVDPKSGKAIDNTTYEGMSEKERSSLVSQKDYELDLADEKLARALKSKMATDQTQRDAQAQAILDVYGNDPIGVALAKATKAGIDPKLIAGIDKKAKPLSAETLKQARETLAENEAFLNAPLEEQLLMIHEAGTMMTSGSLTPSAKRTLGTMPEGLQQKINQALSSKSEAQKAMAQDDFSKLPKDIQQSIMKVGNAMTDRNARREGETTIEAGPTGPLEGAPPRKGKAPMDSMLSWGSREAVTTETDMGRNAAIRKMKQEKPGMTDRYYQATIDKWAEEKGINIK